MLASLRSFNGPYGFTLVELIVVITILVILGTIVFLNLGSFSGSARDGARVSDLTNISKGLDILYVKNGRVPAPDANMVTITASGATIGYQGYAGNSVLGQIKMGEVKDPLDKKYYTYLVNSDHTKYQLLALFEDAGTTTAFDDRNSSIPGIEMAYAGAYNARYPSSKGNSLGVLLLNGTGNLNQPIQETYSVNSFTGVDIVNTQSGYTAYFSSKNAISGTGTSFREVLTISYPYGVHCPFGFIYVPGSSGISINTTTGFYGWCIAKWEMSPNNSTSWVQDGTYLGWNYSGSISKPDPKVTSKSGSYPITWISRDESEVACATNLVASDGILLSNGHILSVALWKKVADNLVMQSINWSGNSPGSGNMSRGFANNSPATSSQGLASDAVANPMVGNFYDRRTWQLSNGGVIHDFAGNISEWYYDTHNNTNTGWTDFTSFNIPKPAFSGISLRPATTAWNSSQGVGKIYFGDTGGGSISTGTTYAAIFGGAWATTTSAGIFATSWSNVSPSADRFIHIGFRCVVPAQ